MTRFASRLIFRVPPETYGVSPMNRPESLMEFEWIGKQEIRGKFAGKIRLFSAQAESNQPMSYSFVRLNPHPFQKDRWRSSAIRKRLFGFVFWGSGFTAKDFAQIIDDAFQACRAHFAVFGKLVNRQCSQIRLAAHLHQRVICLFQEFR